MSRCCYPCPTVSEAQVVRVLLSHCCGWPADCAAVYTWASPCCGRTAVLYKLALRRPLQLALFASRPCPHCCSTPCPEHTEWHCRNIVTHSAVSGDSVPWATVTVWQNCWPQRQLCCSTARRPSPLQTSTCNWAFCCALPRLRRRPLRTRWNVYAGPFGACHCAYCVTRAPAQSICGGRW
jgi:hypothetical protein